MSQAALPPAQQPAYLTVLDGQFRVLPHSPTRQALLDALQSHAIDCIGAVSGDAVANAVRRDSLKYLHRHVDLDHIPRITERFYKTRDAEAATWRMFRAVAQQELEIPEPFYMLREVFLRILPPFSSYRDKPGFHSRRRDVDAVKYRFISHAPHRDSWAGDAANLLNYWMAIDDVPLNAGMYIVPGMLHQDLPHLPDPPFYITRDANVPRLPNPFALAPGECLTFACDELHGTCLNTTDVTRVAVTGRMCPTRPLYRPEFAATNTDEWVISTDVESSAPAFVVVNDSLSVAGRDCGDTAQSRRLPTQVKAVSYSGWNDVGPLEDIPEGQGLGVRIGDVEVAVFRTSTGVAALDNVCPHLYYRLANGPQTENHVVCPGHCLRFDLATGQCADEPTFAVARHAARVERGHVLIQLSQNHR